MAGTIRCILWPDDFVNFGELVRPDAILAARGTIDRRGGGDEANLIVTELIPLEDLASRYTRGLVVRLTEPQHGSETLKSLHEIVRGYPGDCQLQMLLCLADGSRVAMQSDRLRVDITDEIESR